MSPTDSNQSIQNEAQQAPATQEEVAAQIIDQVIEEGIDASDDILLANAIARDAVASDNATRNAIHDILDGVFAKAKREDDEVDVDGLPQRIRRALDMRMPREAIEQINSNYMVVDGDGNLQIVKEHLNTVDSIVIDYLANKIFGPRLNVKVVEHKIVREGVYTRRAGGQDVAEFVCNGFAKVRVSIRLNNGAYWKNENVGLSSWSAPVEAPDEIRRALRVGYVGCVTIARKNALMMFGNVFQCIKDNEGLIERIKETQKAKNAERQNREADLRSQEDSLRRKNGKPARRQKRPLKVDPALAEGDGTKPKSQAVLAKSSDKPKPAVKTADPSAKKPSDNAPAPDAGSAPQAAVTATTTAAAVKPAPAAQQATANPFPLFKADGTARGTLKDAKTFTTEINKLVLGAKSEEALASVLTLHKAGIDVLVGEPKYAGFADNIRAAAEARTNILKEAAAKKAKIEEKKNAKAAKKAKDEAAAAVDASASQAAEQAQSNAAQTAPGNPQDLSDPAGFGPAPGAQAAAPVQAQPAAVNQSTTGYAPTLVTLSIDETGKPTNQQQFGQASLDAIQGSPTKADLMKVAQDLANDLARAPETLRNYLQGQIDRKMKSF